MKKRKNLFKNSLLFVLTVLFAVMMLPASGLSAFAADDGFGTAKQISVNSSYTDNLSTSNELDYYKFSLSRNAMIAVNFSHTQINSSNTYWVVRVYDAEYKELLVFNVKGNSIKSVSASTGLAPGIYYIRIGKNVYDKRDYTFSVNTTYSDYWEKELNNDYLHASDITVNHQYSGSLMNTNDVDYYRFTLYSNSKITISFEHEIIESSSTYWKVDVLTDELTSMESFSVKGTAANAVMPTLGLSSGTYYIKVRDDILSSKDYHFTVDCVATNYWEKEINNDFATASYMNVNAYYHGSLNGTNDKDYYQFNVYSDSKVQIEFLHDYIDSASTYWYITLYDGDYNAILQKNITGKTSELVFPNIGLQTGTYYLYIRDDVYNGMDYTLCVNCSDVHNWETERNNSYATGDPITFNTSYYGSMSDTNDVDYYTFSLSSPAEISVDFSHDYSDSSSAYWYVSLCDTNGSKKTGFYVTGKKTFVSGNTVSLDSGDYYLKISNDIYNGMDYSFVVNGPANTFIVTYDANGGSGAPAPQTKYLNQPLTLSNTRPTRPGYNFLGWSTIKITKNPVYYPGSVYTDNAGVTLYAVWKMTEIAGDANSDGKVDVRDVTAIMRYLSTYVGLAENQRNLADVNHNGWVDVGDATMIQRYLADYSSSL